MTVRYWSAYIPGVDRRYDSAWAALSRTIRAEHPWCVMCRAEAGESYVDAAGNERTVRLTVDHIDGNTAHNERANLRVLCDRCHGSLTGNEWRR